MAFATTLSGGRSERRTKERFFEAHDTARRLLADFRAVEQNFRAIAADPQRAQLNRRRRDPVLQTDRGLPVADLSVPFSQVARLDRAGRRRLVIENKLMFLTLPERPNPCAIFGSGHAVVMLGHAAWLAACSLDYWGDLDAHGFGIWAQ